MSEQPQTDAEGAVQGQSEEQPVRNPDSIVVQNGVVVNEEPEANQDGDQDDASVGE